MVRAEEKVMSGVVKLLDAVITGLTIKDNIESAYIESLMLVKIATKEGRDVTQEELDSIDGGVKEEFNKWRTKR